MDKIIKIFGIVSKLVSILKYTHYTRRTYNDLKLDNIMVNVGKSNKDADPEIFLIDYGFSDKYFKKEAKKHIDESESTDKFRGNMMFASAR